MCEFEIISTTFEPDYSFNKFSIWTNLCYILIADHILIKESDLPCRKVALFILSTYCIESFTGNGLIVPSFNRNNSNM